jgi:hypothetical protein
MSDDPILDSFADLAEEAAKRYPGSKVPIEGAVKKRQATAKKKAADAEEVERDEAPAWIENRFYMREMHINGEKVVFYTLAALAEALLRKPVTIRAWESAGKFPPSPFRTKANGALGGKRLYTRKQIEGVVAMADDEGLLYVQRPLTPQFTARVQRLFHDIRQEIRKGN